MKGVEIAVSLSRVALINSFLSLYIVHFAFMCRCLLQMFAGSKDFVGLVLFGTSGM